MARKRKKLKEDRNMVEKEELVEDRISDLPECLIHHILSFLSMKDVVKTSLLSRRWRKVWTSTPVLKFCGDEAKEASEFATLISTSLLLYEDPKIREFAVDVDSGVINPRIVDSWIHFVVRHDVEVLRMRFTPDANLDGPEEIMEKLYEIPRCLSSCHLLKLLDLVLCDIKMHSSLPFRFLKTLQLRAVNFKTLDASSCPCLENVSLHFCNIFSNLDMHFPNERLKRVEIRDDSSVVGSEYGLSIYAPKLLTVSFGGCIRSNYNIKDLSSFVSADLEFNDMAYEYAEITVDGALTLVKLFGNLSHVRTLKLSQWCIEALCCGEMKGWKAPAYSATTLMVETSLNISDVPGFAYLLRGSSHLQRLRVDVRVRNTAKDKWGLLDDVDEDTCWKLLGLELSASVHLKTVEIINLLGRRRNGPQPPPVLPGNLLEVCKGGIKLVEMLLSCCMELDRFEINPTQYYPLNSKMLLILTKKLLLLPRASANAKIYFR